MKREMPDQVLRGQMYFADLNPIVGSEQGGVRPVLVIQNNEELETAASFHSLAA